MKDLDLCFLYIKRIQRKQIVKERMLERDNKDDKERYVPHPQDATLKSSVLSGSFYIWIKIKVKMYCHGLSKICELGMG